MSDSAPVTVGAVALVCLLTLALGLAGGRFSRRTSDFYVAGRAVTSGRNAAAICGEYLSAASFLGVAGLVYEGGVNSLWYPVGYTLGYLVLLVLVAAPLRRSGAYTLPDFAEFRLQSRRVRLLVSWLVVAIGWLYLMPQFLGAGITLTLLTGAPRWFGGLIVLIVVLVSVASGGMRAITLTQAVQFWIKLTAITVPACVLLALWWQLSGPSPVSVVELHWWQPRGPDGDPYQLYRTLSLMLALCLGTMGLPHVVVRFYTNPDGAEARLTTVKVVGLLGVFYLFVPIYGVLGRAYLPTLPPGRGADSIVLLLPTEVVSGAAGVALTAVLAGGAFAAFLSTASGLAMSVTGVLHQDVIRPLLHRVTSGDSTNVQGFRMAAPVAVVTPFVASLWAPGLPLATVVTLAFVVAASAFFPLLALGVWWRGLSVTGAAAGLVTGAVLSIGAVTLHLTVAPPGWPGALLAQPGAWTIPIGTAVTVVVSILTPGRRPPRTAAALAQLHTPEGLPR